jgi:predicted AAA+ superfamily ATPase
MLEMGIDSGNGLIQVLIGPRQVGKTTSVLDLIKRRYKNESHYVSADKVFNSDTQWLREQWRIATSKKHILFIDEIQKIENWAEAIKALFDENRRSGKKVRCVLLGSSSLDIQKGLTESLTGRFQQIRAHHWNLHESRIGYNLDFEGFLHFGGYPGSYPVLPKKTASPHSSENTNSWAEYVRHSIIETVVEKDILQYQNVKSPALFRQAFEILISYPAQEISYTKLLGQIQDRGNVELIKNYIRLYEGAFLLRALEKFSNKKIKTKSSSPKILPLAPCLYQLAIRDSYSSEERGRAFELLIGSQLVRTGEDLYYWREGQHEVDFVLKRGRKIWAIEVKSGRKRTNKGMDKFKSLFPEARLVTITTDDYETFEKDPMLFLAKF